MIDNKTYFKKSVFGIFYLCVILCSTNCKKEQGTSKKQLVEEVEKLIISNDYYQSLEKLDSTIYNTSSNNKFYLGLLYFKKGNIYLSLNNHRLASDHFKQANKLFRASKENNYYLRSHLGLGTCYSLSGEKAMATEHLLEALELSKTGKNVKNEAKAYSMLAHTYFQYNDYNKAINYTQKAISLYQKEKDTIGLSETYNNLAVIYKNQGNAIGALEYNLKSLELNKLTKNNSAIAKSYNNLGQVYTLVKNRQKALFYYKKAVKLNIKNGNYNSGALINIGEYYARLKNTKKAKDYFNQALQNSFKTENIFVQKYVADKLLNISLQNKDYKNSLKYQQIRDSLQLLQTQLGNKENLKLNESQYKLIENKVKLQQVNARNMRNRIIFIAVLVILVILGLLFWQRLKNKQLELQKEKIHLESAVLRSQMNPHFIFNALSAIQNSLFDNDPIKSASYLSRFAKLIRQNFDFISEKEITLADELDLLKNYIETQKVRFKEKFDYTIEIDENLDIHTIKVPPLLLQPLVENAIEHGFNGKTDKGIIIVKIHRENNHIQYEVADNGKGFNPNRKDKKLHSISILKKRLGLINNKKDNFTIQSNEKGTCVKFSLLI